MADQEQRHASKQAREVLADLASIHRVSRVWLGAPTRKVPSDLGRWELLMLPPPGWRGHLADAIVA